MFEKPDLLKKKDGTPPPPRKEGRAKKLNPNTLLHTMIVVVVCVAAVVIVSMLTGQKGAKVESRTVDFGLKNVGKLVTQEGYYTNVQVISDNKKIGNFTIPLTTSKAIYSYSGKVTAGLDFEQIEVDVNEKDKIVRVTLPEVEFFDVVIDNDSFKLYDERQSIFTPLSVEDVNNAQSELSAEVKQTATEQGLLDAAGTNAEMLITGIISSTIDLTQYSIVFTEASAE